ncbi:MAG: hypothetical protein GQ540_00715 [Lutibacter sp.]|nr:hypothetical protein [Lutibacter sp.]NOR27031.1 hypothetical protein [Lutibacter sp.]
MKRLIESSSLFFEDCNSSFGVQETIKNMLKTTKKRNAIFNFFIPLK